VVQLRAALCHVAYWHLADMANEAKPGQILISPRVLMAVEDTMKVELVGELTLKGIQRPLTAYNVIAPSVPNPK
jgi:class 3 adenylate cyclase